MSKPRRHRQVETLEELALEPTIIDKALRSVRESREIEFKSEFNPSHKRQWCELIKDIIAIANSGGGIIVFGVGNDGRAIGSDVSSLLSLDPAIMTDKINKYTGVDYDQFELKECKKGGFSVACLILEAVPVPIIPIRPGAYEREPGKVESAFAKGVFFYRHGAKSEPGTTQDLEKVIKRNVREVRHDWIAGIRKIANAPKGSILTVQPKDVRVADDPSAQPIRITDNAQAPEFRLVHPDKTHPYRMKELLEVLNREFPSLPRKINFHDIKALSIVYDLFNRVEFTYKPEFGSRKYSPAFKDWISENIIRDQYFLRIARTKLRRIRRSEH